MAPTTLIAMSVPEALVLTMEQSAIITTLAAVTQAKPSSVWVPASLVEWSEERQVEGA